jgi:hypothetical protein
MAGADGVKNAVEKADPCEQEEGVAAAFDSGERAGQRLVEAVMADDSSRMNRRLLREGYEARDRRKYGGGIVRRAGTTRQEAARSRGDVL